MEFEELFVQKLEESFELTISEKQSKKGYKNFFEFEKDMKEFELEFQELEPQGPQKELILKDFVIKKITEGIYYYQN